MRGKTTTPSVLRGMRKQWAGLAGAIVVLSGVAASVGFATKATKAPAATADLTCVVAYPVWVLNHQLTDQYEVCVPTP
jgi:hypothetical protein